MSDRTYILLNVSLVPIQEIDEFLLGPRAATVQDGVARYPLQVAPLLHVPLHLVHV